jgi:tRNA-dihydrouridine synthase B
MFRWAEQQKKGPIYCLAPMEGYTDSSYRRLVKSFSPEIICYTEFTSADGLKYGSSKSFEKISFTPEEVPLIVQVFGKEVKHFVEIAPIIEQMGAAAIDINMGCPSKKVTNSCHGSALFRCPDLAQEIVYHMSRATNLDVSAKIRLGYEQYDPEKLIEFAKGLEAAGAKAIAVHGRTTAMQYTGQAMWDPIYLVKQNVSIPVIGNGDIVSPEIAKKRLTDGVIDGIMVGRATFGCPWFFRQTIDYINGKEYTPPTTIAEIIEVAIRQAQYSIEHKGEKVGMLEMRKHLANYIKGFPGATDFRFRLVRVETFEEMMGILQEVLAVEGQ